MRFSDNVFCFLFWLNINNINSVFKVFNGALIMVLLPFFYLEECFSALGFDLS